jgi:hypothetical protein
MARNPAWRRKLAHSAGEKQATRSPSAPIAPRQFAEPWRGLTLNKSRSGLPSTIGRMSPRRSLCVQWRRGPPGDRSRRRQSALSAALQSRPQPDRAGLRQTQSNAPPSSLNVCQINPTLADTRCIDNSQARNAASVVSPRSATCSRIAGQNGVSLVGSGRRSTDAVVTRRAPPRQHLRYTGNAHPKQLGDLAIVRRRNTRSRRSCENLASPIQHSRLRLPPTGHQESHRNPVSDDPAIPTRLKMLYRALLLSKCQR